MTLSLEDLKTPKRNTWCPGCGNFAIERAVKRVIVELELDPEKVFIVSGIGCHGKIADYVKVNSFHVIHGRVLPVATGAKLVNPELTVMGFAGDGDAYAIGLGHLPHAIRRNIDIAYFVHDNKVFGLTTGQLTPTSPLGFKSRSTPFGSIEAPINPITLSLALGGTFVARGYVARLDHLTNLVKEAVMHKGFAFVDVLQPCFTFYNTYDYYNERVYELEERGHDASDWGAAYEKAQEWDESIPIGVFYRTERATMVERIPHLSEVPPARQDLRVSLKVAMEEFL